MRVVIVDDEALARQRVRRLVQAEPEVEVVGEAASGSEAVRVIRETAPDLVCLDVQMPGGDGFEVLRQLDGGPMPLVLFVTAYDEHAQRAFEVHAVDYVLKPVDADRFHRAFERARRQRADAMAATRLGELLDTVRKLAAGQAELAVRVGGLAGAVASVPGDGTGTAEAGVGERPAGGEGGYPSRLLVRQQGRMAFVRTTDIDWVEADRNYVRLHVGDTVHVIRERISALAEQLDPRIFARIHRSTIVNLNRVREMQQWFSGDYLVQLDTGAQLRLSRNYREAVERQLGR
ncbi:MAG: LytTR family DNA-binding domain-containing protein [Gemmatimonadetes bacterium]|nr:LytTR family DNA-binding domain-containing protein [Gemmatimonadota bacterium]